MPASTAIAPLSAAVALAPLAIAPLSGTIAPLSVSDSSPGASPRVFESLDRAQALVKAAKRHKVHATRRFAPPRSHKLRFAVGLGFAPPTAMNGTYHVALGPFVAFTMAQYGSQTSDRTALLRTFTA
jgi:hypothetical protein